MTVISSLFSGISGIVANGSALSVAGDNIANMSTPAFKTSSAVFETALTQKIGLAEVGLGSRLAATSSNFTQGSFSSSTRDTDLAVQGKGFFIVDNASGSRFYTRAGYFERNSSGQLVTSGGGFILQGYSISDDANETVSGTLSAISLQTVSSSPVETDEIEFSLNLDASADTGTFTVGTTSSSASSFALAEAASNFSVSQTVYDSLGVSHSITTYFTKTAANTWSYNTLVAGEDLENYDGAAGGTVILARGTIVFDTDGSISSVTPDTTGDEDGSGNVQAEIKLHQMLRMEFNGWGRMP